MSRKSSSRKSRSPGGTHHIGLPPGPALEALKQRLYEADRSDAPLLAEVQEEWDRFLTPPTEPK